jgi:hypothetical protein
MAKIKFKWNSERILSLSAMTISFLTLLIFLYQTNLIKKQNYLSILPYVSVSTSDNPEEQSFELNLYNHGVGPAIVESVTMLYEGKRYDLSEYQDDLYEFLRNRAPQMDSIKSFSASTIDKRMAIPANSKYNVFRVYKSAEDYKFFTANLNRLLNEGLDYEIIYRSIQNERWLIHKDSEGPRKLD